MSDKLNITLHIGGKPYPLTIDRAKEGMYRRAEKEVNRLVDKFRGQKFSLGAEGFLAMAALQLALSNVSMEMSRSLGSEIEELAEMDRALDEYLNSLK